jgi:energy-coupling factor transport system ATP-binding protein
MAGRPVLEVESLTFTYRRATGPALNDLSFSLDAGEVLLVAGPSGCGKSTLIRAINGLIPHSYRGELAGRVAVDGHATHEVRLRDLAVLVGTVLQDPRKQLVASTVSAELAFGPENLGMPRDEIRQRLAEVATASGIEHLTGRTTDQLSGGEGQQLAIAGALMLRPQLLVLDEPLANLDPAAAHRLLGLIRRLADGGTAIVIVEHRVEDVLDARPDRVLYLERGATRYLGPLDGFLAVVDPSQVKVPFAVHLARARANGGQGRVADIAPRRERRVAPHEAAARIEWRGVVAGYDERVVLHGVSARLGSAERVAVLGPNGSGKTTLFKSGIGLIPHTAGEVLVDGAPSVGRSVADLATIFGYVFQNPSQMLFAPTVREEILFGPQNLGRDASRFDALVATAVARVNLAEEAGIEARPPLTLSFGQQKRLAIAVALALEPRTLVLDEPSAGQDHRSATAFMREVERIDRLESVYFVTHDADLALTHADRILLMRDGRIVADGTPLEVIADRERWEAANLRFTSLMEANARWSEGGGRFMGAQELAARMVVASGETEGKGSTALEGARHTEEGLRGS